MFDDTPKTITNFKLLEKEEFINYSDDITGNFSSDDETTFASFELIFIELAKEQGIEQGEQNKAMFHIVYCIILDI